MIHFSKVTKTLIFSSPPMHKISVEKSKLFSDEPIHLIKLTCSSSIRFALQTWNMSSLCVRMYSQLLEFITIGFGWSFSGRCRDAFVWTMMTKV